MQSIEKALARNTPEEEHLQMPSLAAVEAKLNSEFLVNGERNALRSNPLWGMYEKRARGKKGIY